MRLRRLRTLSVSAIGLGCMGLSEYHPGRDAKSTPALHRALDLGITLLDTADSYGDRVNEHLVGRALAGRRDQVVVATKFGVERIPYGKGTRVNGRPDYVRAACDASLRRLGTDVIDLYYQHHVDPDVPLEETWGAMADLVAAGKVRHLGIVDAGPEMIRRADAVHPVTAVQTEYSVGTRAPEVNGVLDTCRELGIGLVARSPLGRGLLAGTGRDLPGLAARDIRRADPRFAVGNLAAHRTLADRLASIAEVRGCTVAQLAIAWLLHQGFDIVPIPGTGLLHHLYDNAEATTVFLDAIDLGTIDHAAPVTPATWYTDEVVGRVPVVPC
ncbi:aldo/keto reductase [Polymorphospora rubra]|uniref:Aldo/keto reductase n=1 Tax=Polymorphospora rubra TaxID=338584 RepID=A0A810N130_9ACTN|nr:aldo/keto reductase [Polymorphospora rubra]BCJ67301.1 aldo/keto reductase [Polymorphospora rubra]